MHIGPDSVGDAVQTRLEVDSEITKFALLFQLGSKASEERGVVRLEIWETYSPGLDHQPG